MPFPNPYKSRDLASDNTFPAAYRAWAYWVSVVGYGCLQVAQIRHHVANTDSALPMLCEVYARAVMETVMSLVFDATDSHADDAVFAMVGELYGVETALEVVRLVSNGSGSDDDQRGVLVIRASDEPITVVD